MIHRHQETKYHTNQAAGFTIGNVSAAGDFAWTKDITDVALPAAGAQPTDTVRIGDEIEVSRIAVKFQIEQRPFVISPQIQGQTIRVIMFQWRPNSVFAATNRPTPAEIAQLLQPGPSVLGVVETNSLSMLEHDRRSQFNILYDKIFKQVDVNNADSCIVTRSFNLPIKRMRKKIQFQGGNTNGMYHVWLLVVGLQNEAVAYGTYNIRTYFKDA